MLIDIYNDRYEHQGTATKQAAHSEGLWHRTFSCLAVNPHTRQVLLQKKAPGRYRFERPDYADITVGGHYEAGETVEDGVREIHEELGLDITYQELQPIGLRQTAITLADEYIEREFQHWHLLPLDVDIAEIPLKDLEVSGLVAVDISAAIALAADEIREAPATFLTRDRTERRVEHAMLTSDDLIPNYLRFDLLYLRLFISADRYCHGQRRHLFW